MFSIEKTIEELILFARKLIVCFYTVLINPEKILDEKKLTEELLKPLVYMLIAMLMFLAFVQLNIFIIVDPLQDIIANYLHFLSDSSIGSKILYVIPLGLSLYIIINLLGKILFKEQIDFIRFRNYCFYWIGTALLLYTISSLQK